MYLLQLEEVFEFVERDLDILGATAVEDKLQENVPETICSLRDSGIKVPYNLLCP